MILFTLNARCDYVIPYGHVVYNWVSNELFHQSLESLQYSAAIAITGAIRGTSEKLFLRTRPENPKIKTVAEKLCFFYKLIKDKSLSYLLLLIPEHKILYSKKSNIFFQDKNKLFQNFFLAGIMDWNKIDVNICSLASCNVFKRVILKFILPEPT